LAAEVSEFAPFYEWQGSACLYWSCAGAGGWAEGGFWNTMRVIFGFNRPLLSDADPSTGPRAAYLSPPVRGNGGELGFGGPHGQLFMSVFSDGSVHPLSLNIDNSVTGVLYRLGNRHDGMTIDESAF